MKENSVNRLASKYGKLKLDKDNISELFVKLENRRDIRKATVKKLFNLLVDGKHFETPLVSNKNNGKHRLLDGNHRLEAIEKYLKIYPKRKVEIFLFYYEGLDEQEEKKLYTKWNLGTKQTTNDFVKQYWKDIPMTKWMEKDISFPYKISHIWSNSAIEFKTLIGGYLTKHDNKFNGGFSGSAIEFIEKSIELNRNDFNKIKEFLSEYISVFGRPDRRNAHYRQAVFYSLIRIWLDNHESKNPSEIKKAYLKLRGHERIIYYQSFGGTRDMTTQCRYDLLNVINGRRTKNPFV